MVIKKITFVKSSSALDQCPEGRMPEYAFLGRSNVGKSSLINMLSGRKKIAKTSATPGKTRLINHFDVDGQWYLADLPGYGYARISRSIRQSWEKLIRDYVLKRPNLMCLFLLIDIRLKPQLPDLSFMEFLGARQVPFVLLFTKSDKLSPQKARALCDRYLTSLEESWEALPEHFITSAKTGTGRTEILDFIERANKLWKK
jgi:GTP-binding protein